MIKSAAILAVTMFSQAAFADTNETIATGPVTNHTPEISDGLLIAQVMPSVDIYHDWNPKNNNKNVAQPSIEKLSSPSIERALESGTPTEGLPPKIYGEWEFRQRSQHDRLAQYHVVELTPYDDPKTLCVTIEAAADTASDCFARGTQSVLSKGDVLQTYETEYNRFYEISLASDETKICQISVGKWGGIDIDCRDMPRMEP